MATVYWSALLSMQVVLVEMIRSDQSVFLQIRSPTLHSHTRTYTLARLYRAQLFLYLGKQFPSSIQMYRHVYTVQTYTIFQPIVNIYRKICCWSLCVLSAHGVQNLYIVLIPLFHPSAQITLSLRLAGLDRFVQSVEKLATTRVCVGVNTHSWKAISVFRCPVMSQF